MSDADQTIGTLRGVIEYSNTDVYSNIMVANTTSTTATRAANSEFFIFVYSTPPVLRGNTEAIFYGGLAAATAVSYQLVEG